MHANATQIERLRADQGVRLVRVEADDAEPKWNLLFPRGTWYGANLAPIGGKIDLTDLVFADMIANWRAAGAPSLPVWFNHPDDDATLSGVPSEERKKAAGWFEDFRVGADGLEALTRWTPNARARIAADEYRFFSAEWTSKHIDRRTGESKGWWIYGAALLNDPFFNALPRVAAAVPTHNPTPGAEPTTQEKCMNQEMKKRLCAALGLPETTPDEEVLSKCEAKCRAGETDANKVQAAAREQVELVAKPLRESLEAERAKLEAAQKRIDTLEAERSKKAVDELCDELVKAGQILPAHRENVVAFAKATSVDEARKIYSALPKNPPKGGETGLPPGTEAPADVSVLKAEYEAELDKAAKAGESTITASRRLRADPKFRPYLVASAAALTKPSPSDN